MRETLLRNSARAAFAARQAVYVGGIRTIWCGPSLVYALQPVYPHRNRTYTPMTALGGR